MASVGAARKRAADPTDVTASAAKRLATSAPPAAAAASAAEPTEAEVDARVLEACADMRSMEFLTSTLGLLPTVIATAVNRLSSKGTLKFFPGKDGSPLFKRAKESSRHTEMESYEERIVYQHVEDAGNTGIWTKHLRLQTGIEKAQFSKVIKKLENKKLIKSVNSVSATKRKFYMLYELQPDVSLTGGAWYTGTDFDAEFIMIMSQLVYKYVEHRDLEARAKYADNPLMRLRKSLVTAADVHGHIEASKASKEALGEKDVLSLLDVLVHGGKVESHPLSALGADHPALADGDGDEGRAFRFRTRVPTSGGVLASPCGVCPVFARCTDGGIVSPQTCVYFDNW
mmetsp:Transcript_20969/g.54567  ORF Transcript_20969/g.54567 Transcript_20969/m.54567 type:complete len:343 (+) Transcript_20969:359-1387(+)